MRSRNVPVWPTSVERRDALSTLISFARPRARCWPICRDMATPRCRRRRRVLQDACRAFAADYGTARIGAQLFSATERLGIAGAEAAINAWIADRTAGAQKERPRHQGE